MTAPDADPPPDQPPVPSPSDPRPAATASRLRTGHPNARQGAPFGDQFAGPASSEGGTVRRRFVGVVVGSGVVGLAAVIVLTGGLRRSADPVGGGPTTTAATVPGGVPSPPRPWWDSVRTSVDGKELRFRVTSGPAFDEDDPCSVDLWGLAVERSDTVEVSLISRRGGQPDDDAACMALGYPRTVTVALRAPLRSRPVVDPRSGASVIPIAGATLLEPDPMPDGWSLLPGEQGAETVHGPALSRSFGATAGAAPAPSATVGQGPPEAILLYIGSRVGEREITIHGERAWSWSYQDARYVTWVEAGQGITVSSSTLDAAALEAFAASLRRP